MLARYLRRCCWDSRVLSSPRGARLGTQEWRRESFPSQPPRVPLLLWAPVLQSNQKRMQSATAHATSYPSPWDEDEFFPDYIQSRARDLLASIAAAQSPPVHIEEEHEDPWTIYNCLMHHGTVAQDIPHDVFTKLLDYTYHVVDSPDTCFDRLAAIIRDMVHAGVRPTPADWKSLVLAYDRWGRLQNVPFVLEQAGRLRRSDMEVSMHRGFFTAILTSYMRDGHVFAAQKFVDGLASILEPDQRWCSRVLNVFEVMRQPLEVWKKYRRMLNAGLEPNLEILHSVLKALRAMPRFSTPAPRDVTSDAVVDCDDEYGISIDEPLKPTPLPEVKLQDPPAPTLDPLIELLNDSNTATGETPDHASTPHPIPTTTDFYHPPITDHFINDNTYFPEETSTLPFECATFVMSQALSLRLLDPFVFIYMIEICLRYHNFEAAVSLTHKMTANHRTPLPPPRIKHNLRPNKLLTLPIINPHRPPPLIQSPYPLHIPHSSRMRLDPIFFHGSVGFKHEYF